MFFYRFFLILFIFITPFLASDYYIKTNETGQVVISDSQSSIIDHSMKEFINRLNSEDNIFFRKGDFFPLALSFENKNDIHLGAYGEESKPLPIIDSRETLDLSYSDIQIVYLSGNGEIYKDESWKSVEEKFRQNYDRLSPNVKNSIASSFDDVKESMDLIVRFHIPIKDKSYFDPEALRVWFYGQEILKAMLFEELKCEDCDERIKWFYEGDKNYLYLFSIDYTFNLFDLYEKIKINNQYLDTMNIKNSSNIFIDDLDMRGGKFSLGIRDSENIFVDNCKIGSYAFSGVHIQNDKNVQIKNCEINSKFPFLKYRYHSSRGAQEGIFMTTNAKECIIKNNTIKRWGHAGINLTTYADDNDISKNQFINNVISGDGLAYSRGIGVDGKKTIDNLFISNTIKDTTARNQFNGMNNTFKYNYIANVKNSQVKKDQGYGVGQGIEIQGYGSNNIAKGNVIEKNVFLNCDEAAISLLSHQNDSEKTDIVIKENRIINCGNNAYNPDYANCAITVTDSYEENKTIFGNSYIKNQIFSSKNEAFILYDGESMDVETFNLQNGFNDDVIEQNSVKFY